MRSQVLVLLSVPLVLLAGCSAKHGAAQSDQQGDSTGDGGGSPGEISLQATLQGLAQTEGAAQVKAAMHQYVAAELSDPNVNAQVDTQIDSVVDAAVAGQALPPTPILPFSTLSAAQAIFSEVPGQDPAPSPPAAFDLDPSTSSCQPTRSQLSPVAGLSGLTTGTPDDPTIDDCTLAHLQAFVAALNGLAMGDGTTVTDGAKTYTNVSDVIGALLQTDTITVEANRYFANFLGLYYNGQSVVAPIWIDTGIPLPSGGTLVVPAPHSGYSMVFSGPRINGTIEFFMGVGTGTMFRVGGARPAWSGGRAQYTYRSGTDNAKIVQVASTAADIRKKWTNEALAKQLPSMGYGILGVCMDSSALIEEVTEGRSTLFPLTHPRPTQNVDYIDGILAELPTDLAGFDPNEALGRIATSMPMSSDELQKECPTVANEMQALGLSW